MRPKNERGDTLIEVLIAITILSLAVVISQAVMNYGQSIALNSIERTTTQGYINSQFSYLRYARDAFDNDQRNDVPTQSAGAVLWGKIETFAVGGTTNAEACDGNRPRSEASMFFIDETTALTQTTPAQFATAATQYPRVSGSPVAAQTAPAPGSGLWLLARANGSGSERYIDFTAKACWTSLVGGQPEKSTSVLRLYAPL